MNSVLKFIARLSPREQTRIWNAIKKIRNGDKTGKKLKGTSNLLCLRVDKIRITYRKTKKDFVIHDINWRGNIYKKLNHII